MIQQFDPSQFDSSKAVFVISVAAELAGMHAQTLRLYERRGLVNPARTISGSRRYSAVDISRLQRIQELTNEGMNLEGVKQVIALEARVAKLEAEKAALLREVEGLRQPSRALVPLSSVRIRTWRTD